MGITILRLGHRIIRDQRITTHVALTARAFGADRVIISGEKDDGVVHSVAGVCEEFGGDFAIEYAKDWRAIIKEWKGLVVHLTMYGMQFNEVIQEIRAHEKHGEILAVVGGSKVPPEVYDWADYNVAIGNQPHSEVAAVAVFLREIIDEEEVERKFKDAKKTIVPSPKGKKVVEH